jgi:diamine N-acetyltransferase
MEYKNLKFRAVEFDDFERLVDWENEIIKLRSSSNIFPHPKHIFKYFIDDSKLTFQERGMFRFIVEDKNKNIIGYVDLYEYDSINNRAKTSCFVDKKHRNEGYGYKMKKFIIDYAFNKLNLYQIYWEIYSDNENSLRLTNKFKEVRKVGVLRDWIWKDGKYIDSYIFQIINNKIT